MYDTIKEMVNFLKIYENTTEGIYTTARTVGQNAIVEWGIHVKRIGEPETIV